MLLITLVNTYFSSESSIIETWHILCADFRYVFSFSLARQFFEIQKGDPQFHESQMKLENLHEIDEFNNANNTFSVLNDIHSVVEVQHVEYLPA